MKTKMLVLATLMLAGSLSLWGRTHVSVGIGIGVGGYGYGYYGPPPVVAYGPPPPPPAVYYAPPCPGPGFAWVSGYWYPMRGHYYWRRGYWAPPAYRRPVRPYVRGYWRR